jgi:hypothetical protein
MKQEKCRLCSSKLPDPILLLPDTPIANEFLYKKSNQEKFPLQLASCDECHHYQLNYSVPANRLFNKDYVFVTGTSPVNVKYFEKYAQDIVNKFDLKPGDFVFEIAANDGTLLKAFRNLGMKVIGVDPASNIAKKAGEGDNGVEIIPDFFTEELAKDVVKKYGNPKLVVANNVLAHLDNVIDIIKGVKWLLSFGGVFVFENSYFKDMYVNNLPDLIYHEHMSHMLVHPLMKAFENNNLCLFDVKNTDVHGGSIRGFVSVKSVTRSKNMCKLLEEEKSLGLIDSYNKKIKMNEWHDRIIKLKNDFNSIITGYKNDNKRVVAYGAPAKFTTLSHILDLNKNDIEYVVDDNPLKQNTYSPGLNIPIVNFEKLKNDNPDIIVIMAWNFAASIIDRCNANGFKGKFIIPLPELRIVE